MNDTVIRNLTYISLNPGVEFLYDLSSSGGGKNQRVVKLGEAFLFTVLKNNTLVMRPQKNDVRTNKPYIITVTEVSFEGLRKITYQTTL